MAQARPSDIVIFPWKLKYLVAILDYCLTNPCYHGTTVLFRLRFVNRRFVVLNMSDGLSSSGATGETRSSPKSSPPSNSEPTPKSAPVSQSSDNLQQGKDSRGKTAATGRFDDLTPDQVEQHVEGSSPDYSPEAKSCHLNPPPNQTSAFKAIEGVLNRFKKNKHHRVSHAALFAADIQTAQPGDIMCVWTHEFDDINLAINHATVAMWPLGRIMKLPDAFGHCIVAVGQRGAPFNVGANTLKVVSKRLFFPGSDPTAVRNAELETNRAYITGLPTELFLSYARAVPQGDPNTYETDLSIGSLVRLDARAQRKPLYFVVLAFLVNVDSSKGPSVLLLETNEKEQVLPDAPVR
jgi:hypothetical protein